MKPLSEDKRLFELVGDAFEDVDRQQLYGDCDIRFIRAGVMQQSREALALLKAVGLPLPEVK